MPLPFIFTAPLLLVPFLCFPSEPAEAASKTAFSLTSPAYPNGAPIPAVHAYRGVGQNLSIPFEWTAPPPGTRSFALLIVDPHPVAKNWVHWMVVDIPPHQRSFREGASGTTEMPGHELFNSFGEKGYGGPMPPPGSGVHPYETTLYALNVPMLSLPEKATLKDFSAAIRGKVLAQVTWKGTFQR